MYYRMEEFRKNLLSHMHDLDIRCQPAQPRVRSRYLVPSPSPAAER